jgi:2-hydroxy-3-keto-5-methylthiopentenyl-1-phosphate phosphatase
MKLAIFSDFDGTVTTTDVTDAVLAAFADPKWWEIQQDWIAGKLGAREVLEKQMPLIAASAAEIDRLIDSVEVDPRFADFALACAENGDALYILSDGFDYWIEKILGRALAPYRGLMERIGLYSCGLKIEGDRAKISFPYFPQGCEHGCATCKPGLFDRLRNGVERTVVIGDGISDVRLAGKSDLILARGWLERFCRDERIPYRSFSDFRDVIRVVDHFRQTLERNDDDRR